MVNKNIIRLLVLLLPLKIFPQLNVTTNGSAAALAQAIAGSGITISSASLNCGSDAAGSFTYSGTNLGVPSGIILTTGLATDAANPGGYWCDSINGNTYHDPDLTAIEPTATNDVCILEFNFVPVCDTVKITFVFGSEEYPDYVGSYNDGFGIFLTGPKPSGGNYVSQNIGTLPDGTAVSINNVNAGSNSSFFHNNYTNRNNDIAYDGYTLPISSITPVVPCSTYHMKIAIADATDGGYDSGVFIGGNAVSCSTPPIIPAIIVSNTPASCGASDGSVSVSVTNYTGTPTYSWMPGGQTTAAVTNLPVGTYTCEVGLQTRCATYIQSVVTTINNATNLNSTSASQNATCANSSNGSATVIITGGNSPYSTVWNTAPVQSGTLAVNLTPGTYIATVTDSAGCKSSVSVVVGIIYPTVLQASNVSVCGSISILNAPAGSAYQWYTSGGIIIGTATSSTYNAIGITNGQFYIVGYTDNTTGCRDSTKIIINRYNLGFIASPSSPCHGINNGSLSFTPASGNNFTSFDWSLNGDTAYSCFSCSPHPFGPNVTIGSLAGGTYTVVIAQAGNPTCSFTYTNNLIPDQISVAPTDTIRACNLDTVKVHPSVAPGSINNWYTDLLDSLGITAAGVPLSLFPPPHSGNVNVNGAGYIDSVRSASGCLSVNKVYVKTMSFQKGPLVTQQLKCHNDSTGKIKISVVRENNGPINRPYHFTWYYPSPYNSPGTVLVNLPLPVSSIETNLHAGTYTCVIKAGNCYDTVTYTLVNPNALPIDTLSGYYCSKDSLGTLIAKPGYTQYHWLLNDLQVTMAQNSNYNNDSIIVPVKDIPNYWVTYNKGGCSDTAKILLSYSIYNAFIPGTAVNIFTPNDDKVNDFFYPFYDKKRSPYEIDKQAESYQLNIYNRWGRLVFETDKYAKPWDGKDLNGVMQDEGTYYYIAKYKSNCSTKADIVTQKGFVQLLR